MLRLLALLLPLSLDTFAVAAALGAAGISGRLRLSLIFVAFEAAMPLLGIGIGQAIGHTVGSVADYLASAALIALGVFLVFGPDDDADAAATLARARGAAVIGLGVSISLDELAIGFSAGLLHLPLAWAILLIGSQALIAAQLGFRLGAHISERGRERAERLAGVALCSLGVLVLAERIA